MSLAEGMPNNGPEVYSSGEVALEGMIYDTEWRYIEALGKRQEQPGVVWLSKERIEGVEGNADEHAMWFRLCEEQELLPGVDWFDVGIVVEDPNAPNPPPATHDLPDRHFYVRRWTKRGPMTGIIFVGNALEAASPNRPIIRHALINDLHHKLSSYFLHNIRMWTDGSSGGVDDIVA